MAVSHIQYNHGSQHGAILHGATIQFEDSFARLNRLKETMDSMIDGDGTSADHFTYMASKFGFSDNATAKTGYETLATALQRLNAPGPLDAINKVCNRLR